MVDEETSQVIRRMNKAKIFAITVSDTFTLNNLIADLKGLPETLFAEENYDVVDVTTPNDPDYGNQWGLKNNDPSQIGHDIHAEGAWDITTGNPNSIIAIIDEGIQRTHEDFGSKVVGGDNSFFVAGNQSHGTVVAGIAAAIGNNSKGIAGVDWQAKILPMDKHDYYKGISIDWFTHRHGAVLVSQKIEKAVDYSDNVWTLNNSYTFVDHSDKPVTSVVLRDAFTYAYAKNRVSVVSSGNTGTYIPNTYPASISTGGLIAVGASNGDDKGSASTYGPFTDVVAPGYNYTTNYGNSYTDAAGSSIAAPLCRVSRPC